MIKRIFIIFPFRGIKWFFKHLWIFLVYMWTVICHLKHGACPYMMFEEAKQKTHKIDKRAIINKNVEKIKKNSKNVKKTKKNTKKK